MIQEEFKMVEGQEKRLNENYEIMEEFQAVREIALKVEQEKGVE